MQSVGLPVVVSQSFKDKVEEKALSLIIRALIRIERKLNLMANDFSQLTAVIDNVVAEIAEVVAILQNPAVDNNDQAIIDALVAKLNPAASSLGSVLPAPAPAPTA
jgi:hypothetical protein